MTQTFGQWMIWTAATVVIFLLVGNWRVVWAGCNYETITTHGEFKEETCDVSCEDNPEECAEGESTSTACRKVPGGSAGSGGGIYTSVNDEEDEDDDKTTSVCFSDRDGDGENDDSGCINGTYCRTYCGPNASGKYTDTASVWVCDDTEPTPEPESGSNNDDNADGNGDISGSGSCDNGVCSTDESCETCPSDCGACEDETYCGDGICAGFENCLSCEADCGTCPTNYAWWQVWGGHIGVAADTGFAVQSLIPDETTCIEPDCHPYLSALDRAGTSNSDGFLVTGLGIVNVNGRFSAREENTFAVGAGQSRFRETYSYFASQYSLGLEPEENFGGQAEDAQKPAFDDDKDYYFHSGDLIIQSPWDVSANESYVIFIDGNLYLQDPDSIEQLITVAEGGFLAFIVSGDITIAADVRNATLNETNANLEGIYIADGVLTIKSNGTADKRFIGEGTFVGWEGVELQRDFGDEDSNSKYPAETFIFRPDFVKNTPEKMKRSQVIWQEVK